MTTRGDPAIATSTLRRLSTWFGAFVLFSTLGLAVAADSVPAIGGAERSRILAQIDSIGRRGFLYEVVRPATGAAHDRRLFLYGTIHVGRVGSEPFNAPVMRALGQSRRLALEADPTDNAAAQRLVVQLGRYGDGDGLERHLPSPLMARVEAFGAKAGLPRDHLVRFKPWLLANMVTLNQMNASGLDSDLGSELYLAGFARGNGMPIVEIEGIETQLRLLASLPEALQAAQLDEALTEADGADDDTLALFELWQNGDGAAADALLARMHDQDPSRVFERYFVDTLIDDRNRTMADRAEQELQRAGTTFFAVGALHLFGDAGLIRTLERRGYRVVDLQVPSAPR